MEARPLTAPHPRLERCVVALIPPAARETVAGDLFEQYRSPAQYVGAALRTLPFVIASQIRRQANIPVLVMQALVVSVCISSLALSLGRHPNMTGIALITAVLLAALLVAEAYGDARHFSEKQAISAAMIFAVGVLAYAYYVLIVTLHANRYYVDLPGWSLFFWLILPFGMPALCALRALLILCRDEADHWGTGATSREELLRHYQRLGANARARNRRNIALLALTSALAGLVFWQAGLRPGPIGGTLAALYALAPVFLLFHGAPQAMAPGQDFLSLRQAVRHEITRQHQLEAFMDWLRPVPLLLLLYSVAFHFPAGPTQRLWLVYASMAAMFGAFLALTMNRDLGARLQAVTARLEELRERPSG